VTLKLLIISFSIMYANTEAFLNAEAFEARRGIGIAMRSPPLTGSISRAGGAYSDACPLASPLSSINA
jgi:hypothetical protein